MYKLHKSEKYQKLTRIFEVPKDSKNCLLTIFYPKTGKKKKKKQSFTNCFVLLFLMLMTKWENFEW